MHSLKNYLLLITILGIALFISCNTEPDNTAISSDGVKIKFDVQGEGEPTLVFVHGWSNHKGFWDAQVSHFSEIYSTVAIDLAGFGESGSNRNSWTMESFSEDVIAVINMLDLQNVVLVGFSMGAPVVIETSNKIPDQISGLILVDILQNIEAQIPQEQITGMLNNWKEIFADKNRIHELLPSGLDQAIIDRYISEVYTVSKTGWWESLEDFFHWSNESCIESLKNLQVPLMSINSTHTSTDVDAYLKYIPSYKLKIIDTISHLVIWEAPDEFNRLLEECIQEFIR